ncbi:acyltransferase [Microcystis flos-aquae FACHB-1344]|uniref:Acyltransferase n=1 Tax=Microcystis flos-aquae FACHB-1344 TaxID=2692899 RepID=A0ABR8HQA7_9CHRO|nr:acyltransferase [Microcystis flos-aquae]MBD2621640.1 acyltransferase [Microcystis flos-aquae FACHB-1344]
MGKNNDNYPLNKQVLPKQYSNFLYGLRGLAALFVLVSHIWYQIWPADAEPLGYYERPTGLILFLTSWLYYGHFAVVIFILLSGFCLMLPVIQGDGTLPGGTVEFLKKRSHRILPPYYFALLFSLFLIDIFIGTKTGSQWDISIPVTRLGVIADLLMLQDFIAPVQVNYVFWSLAVIWQLYLCFPLIILSWQRLGSLGTTIAVGFLSYTIILLLEAAHVEDVPPQYIGLFFDFTLGVLAATLVFSQDSLWIKIREYFPSQIIAVICGLLIIGLCYLWGFDKVEQNLAFLDNLCAFATLSILVAGASLKPNFIKDILCFKPLVFAGTFSYSLYLIHAPLLQLIWQYFLHPLGLDKASEFFGLLVIAPPLIIGFSLIFFRFFERPFLNRRSRSVNNDKRNSYET